MSASTFSYAQAARGQVATQSTGQTDVSNGLPAGSTTSSAPSTTPSTALSVISNDADGVDQQSGQPDKATPEVNTQTTTDDESAPKTNTIRAPSVVGQDEKSQPVDSSTPSSERKAKGAASSVRSTDPSDAKKTSKKARKPKTAEKDSEAEQAADQEKETEAPPQPQPPLADAPLPAVNAWTQRSQVLKPKYPAVSAGPVQTSSKPTQATGQQTADAKLAKSNAGSGSESNGAQGRQPAPVKNQKRASEPPRDGSRTAPRGSRLAEKSEREATEPLTSVADPLSWPTPESAATEIKVQEKNEKQPEKDEVKDDGKTEAGANQKAKKWVPVPFVPSVNFKTPIRGGRGGRGGSRGGREAGGRGNHAGSASFSERTPGSTKTPAEATGDMAAASKRASVDAAMGSRDIRKPFHAAGDSAKSTQINGKAEPFKPAQNTLSSSASDQHQQGTAENAKETGPKAEHSSRVPDAQRESTHPSSKNAAFQSNGRPEGNSRERRGGAHRGRGGHSGANSQGHHAAFASNGQHFGVSMTGRQNSYGQPGHPQMYSAPFPGGPAPGFRGTNRSQSTSSASYHPRGQANGSKGYRPPPVHTGHPYDPSMHHPASAMAAPMMPYYNPESLSVMPILRGQVQYYFSLENLLKDTFMRKHMDSQGFVFLDLITNFQRIRNLTNDLDLVRAACVEAETVDLVVGQDGRERLRPRDRWEKWVLPAEERHELASKDDGPTTFQLRPHPFSFGYPPMMAAPYGVDPNAVYSPNNVESPYGNFGNDPAYGHAMNNGVNGFAVAGESRLSAAVPEFSPNGPTGQDVPAYMDQPAAANGEAGPSTNGVHTEPPYTNGVGASHEAESH